MRVVISVVERPVSLATHSPRLDRGIILETPECGLVKIDVILNFVTGSSDIQDHTSVILRHLAKDIFKDLHGAKLPGEVFKQTFPIVGENFLEHEDPVKVSTEIVAVAESVE